MPALSCRPAEEHLDRQIRSRLGRPLPWGISPRTRRGGLLLAKRAVQRRARRGERLARPARVFSCLGLLFSFFFFPASSAGQTFDLDLELLPGATGLVRPVAVVDAGDDSGRLFIVEQTGTIRIWQNGALLPQPFLTIPGSELSCCGERGLLGLAFHPNFSDNGYFFVNYTEPESVDPPSCPSGAGCDQNTVVARFRVDSHVDPENGDPDFADFSTQERLLHYNQPHGNHNGGDLHFGPDDYLYISSGDGGSANDPHDYGQDTTTLLGKLLRIDVDGTLPVGPADVCGVDAQLYGIPADNPFAGGDGECDEIWSLGLRNPWRFSFDRDTGDVFIGDVGQSSREEIDFQPASSTGGENWGWRCYEGNAFTFASGCVQDPSPYEFPIHDYSHSSGRCSVTGGFRYRGDDFFLLRGVYFFADFCTGEIWGAREDEGAWSVPMSPDHVAPFNVTSFGEDAEGEPYVLDYDNPDNTDGRVYRLVETLIPEGVAPLDVDGNGVAEALKDGLLVLRYLFGFESEALVAGAVDPADCDRCDAAAIVPVLEALEDPHLDVDDNGAAEALKDGLLILRYLFGFTDEVLVSGAVGDGCERCTAGEIEAYVASLL